jgi:NTP pyrophosphatase (non-canonical NTP hydrolase)
MYNFVLMDINDLTDRMQKLVKEKGWYDSTSLRPQTGKNLAASVCIEAAEILELFQWQEWPPDDELLAGEIADIMLYLLQLAYISGIDLEKAVLSKLEVNHHRQWDQEQKLDKGTQ